jgi:hypothetical protein
MMKQAAAPFHLQVGGDLGNGHGRGNGNRMSDQDDQDRTEQPGMGHCIAESQK